MDNRKNHEATTSFGEVMRTAGIPAQQQYNKRIPEDTHLMILCQGMRMRRCHASGISFFNVIQISLPRP